MKDLLRNTLDMSPVGVYMERLKYESSSKGLTFAVEKLLNDLGISIDIEGHVNHIQKKGFPVLLIGSHRSGYERFAILAAFAQMNRDDIRLIGLKGTKTVKFSEFLSPDTHGHTIYVVPRIFTHEHARRLSLETMQRYVLRETPISTEEAKQINARALVEAAELLDAGNAVSIFPTGLGSMESAWQAGAARIMSLAKCIQHIPVVPYYVEGDFTKLGLLKNMTMMQLGRKHQNHVHVIFGKPQYISPDALPANTANKETLAAVTEQMKQHYLNQFGRHMHRL